MNIPEIHTLNTTFENLISSMDFPKNLTNVRWPSCFYVHWQYEVEADRVEYDPNIVISAPACWTVDTHHLGRVDGELGLCGITKQKKVY